MTEAEWLTGTDHARSFEFVEGRLSPRRSRLLAAALCRAAWPLLGHPGFIAALDAIERHADGAASTPELEEARQRCRVLAIQQFEEAARSAENPIPERVTAIIQNELAWALAFAATTPLSVEAVARRVLETTHPAFADSLAEVCRERVFDVVGNPFRPVVFDPAWRTSTAVGVATKIYDTRDFTAMPILADALQDAGCDSDAVLTHCRDTKQVHVRGCWVVDGVLGKA
jgi:hypothetical protein